MDNKIVAALLLSTLVLHAVLPAVSLAKDSEDSDLRSEGDVVLSLAVVVDEIGSGKTLVTGYVENLEGLSFLDGAEYLYDEKAQELFATTESLVDGDGDSWQLSMEVLGFLDEYHTSFYLPRGADLVRFEGSEGLQYLVSSSEDGVVVEAHGYDLDSPTIKLYYLGSAGEEE